MTSVKELVATAHRHGAVFHLTPNGARITAPQPLPTRILLQLREHRFDVLHLLRQDETGEVPGIDEQMVSDPHLDEVAVQGQMAKRMRDDGIVLLYSQVLKDYIAFHCDNFDHAFIPPGFVPYGEAELYLLFGHQQPDVAPGTLWLIHAAKKSGARLKNIYPEQREEPIHASEIRPSQTGRRP